jgi:hypothetical protein
MVAQVALSALILSAAVVCPLRAQGGPPLETDDPGTPGAGNIEVNVSVEAEREGGGTGYDAPRLDGNLGVGSNVQLKLEIPWRVATSPSEPARTGLGNVMLGVKWRFGESKHMAVSTYPQVTLGGLESSRTRGLADSGTAMLLPVEIAWHTGRLSVGAEGGYERGQGESEVVYGLALAHQAKPSLELLAECHGSTVVDSTKLGLLCGGGFRWAVQEALSVLAALEGRVASSSDGGPDQRLYTGVQLRW